MADTNVKELLEAGVHFGHQTRRWNPRMRPFIFGARGGVHIIDLTKTMDQLTQAKSFARSVAAEGGKVLFVGTKRQAKAIVQEAAQSAGQPFVTERWLGGMLTNFRTIQTRVKRLKDLEKGLESGDFASKYNKKEVLDLTNEKDALQRVFGGIKDMSELPKAVFVIDMVRDDIAISEARNLGIPVIAVVDTNANPALADYPIPANDDAIKGLRLLAGQIAEGAKDGAATHAKQAADKQADGSAE